MLLNLGGAGLLLFTYLAPWISPRSLPQVGLLAIGYPVLAMLNLLLALPWLCKRRREAWISLGALLLGFYPLTSYVGLHPPRERPAHSIRVMTMNANYFDSLRPVALEHKQARIQEFREFLAEEQPDLLCTQDFTADGRLEQPLLRSLEQDCGLVHSYRGGHSQGIFSRYPILDRQETRFPESTNSFVWADVQLPQGRIRVHDLHLESYALGQLARDTPVRDVYRRMQERISLRSQQAEWVAQSIADSPYPVLVCGDFNDVPLSYAYQRISRGLRDGFREAGWGWGITYSGPLPLPLLRIDYILASAQFRFSNYRIPRRGFSDHYSAVCEISER